MHAPTFPQIIPGNLVQHASAVVNIEQSVTARAMYSAPIANEEITIRA